MTVRKKEKSGKVASDSRGKRDISAAAAEKATSRTPESQFTRLSTEGVADPVIWVGADAGILFVNDAACKSLGYTRKELLGMTVFDIDQNFSPDIWAEHWEKIRELGHSMIESDHRRKDGTSYPVEISISHLEFNDKEYHCARVRDISDRRLAEDALRDSEAKFRLLSEQGLLAIVIIQDGLIKYANQAAIELTEYSSKEVHSLEPDEFGKTIHPEDRPFVMEQARRKQRGEKDVVNHYSYRMITKSGKVKWVDLYSKTVNYGGRGADFVSIVDITERKEAEEVLKKAHHELEFLVEERTVELTEANRQLKRRIFDLYTIFELSRNFNAVLNYETLLDSFVLTSMGQMSAAKAALYLPLRIGGDRFFLARTKGSPPFPRREILIDTEGEFGKYITVFNRPIFISEIMQKLPAIRVLGFSICFRDGLLIPLIYQTKLRGMLIISAKESGQRFRDQDIEFLSILANQTAVSIENARLYESEKEALDRLQKTQKLLLQSERLAVLGELSAKIAHEVNNPLGIIKNYISLLTRQSDGDEKIQDYANIIKQEIDRIAVIVRQLLNIHKPMRIKFARTDLVKILRDVLTLISRQLENAGITVSLEMKDPLPEIMAWPDGLKQVFLNLLINAKDAMKSGGEIRIDMTSSPQRVQVTFQDTGPGIDPKHIPHIFEPFYSTKDAESGTGLGLSVCRGIVNNHNGKIEFVNNDLGGCFRIELPIKQEEEEYDWRI